MPVDPPSPFGAAEAHEGNEAGRVFGNRDPARHQKGNPMTEAVKPDRPRSAAGKIFHGVDMVLLKVEEFVLAYGIILLAALLIANVMGRTLFNHSLMFVEEVSQAIVVLVTFLGLGYCTRKARHIRMSAIYDLFGPRVRKVLIVIMAVVTAVTMAAMGYWSLEYMLKVKQYGNVTPTLRFPLWIILVSVPVGFFMAAFEYILTIVKNFREEEVYLSVEVPDGYEDESIPVPPCEGPECDTRADEGTRTR